MTRALERALAAYDRGGLAGVIEFGRADPRAFYEAYVTLRDLRKVMEGEELGEDDDEA